MVRETIKEIEREIEILEKAEKQEEEKILTDAEKAEKAEKQEEERKYFVKSFFRLLTDKEMTEEQYKEYIYNFENFKPSITEDGAIPPTYNIKSYIRDNGLDIKEDLNNVNQHSESQ